MPVGLGPDFSHKEVQTGAEPVSGTIMGFWISDPDMKLPPNSGPALPNIGCSQQNKHSSMVEHLTFNQNERFDSVTAT